MNKQKKNYKIGGYLLGALSALAARYLIYLPFLDPWDRYRSFAHRLGASVFLIFVILLISKLVEKWIDQHEEVEGNRYNLIRITRLIAMIFVVIVALAFLFQNLYAAAASFGLMSLVLGFALQAPITSFIGWLYIIFRKPYKVGDRIQLKNMRGDIIEIHYLDTIIRECSGDYLGNDHESGRLIHFPNSVVLTAEIINYTGELYPFIWNETALQIAYTSDLEIVEACLLASARADFEARYPHLVGDAHAAWLPKVYFRSNSYAWMEAVVSYAVEPTDTTGRRNRILRDVMPRLNEAPELVQFPEGTRR